MEPFKTTLLRVKDYMHEQSIVTYNRFLFQVSANRPHAKVLAVMLRIREGCSFWNDKIII